MDLSNIRNIDDLRTNKAKVRVGIDHKEREFANRVDRLQLALQRFYKPVRLLQNALSWATAVGVHGRGRSMPYKIGYAVASAIFRRKR